MTLEREFKRYEFLHKYDVIQSALILFADEGIYDHYLFKNKYDDIEGTADEKARTICHKLADLHFDNNDDVELNEMYNYCWDRLSKILPENTNFKIELD